MTKFNFNDKVKINNSALGDSNTINNFLKDNSDISFDDTDKEFIKLIHENVESLEERKQLLESLKISNTPEEPENKKSVAKEIMISFLTSSFTETGKIIALSILSKKFGIVLPS